MNRSSVFPILGLLACTATSAAVAQIIDPDPSHSFVQGQYLSVEGYTTNAPAP